MPKNDFSKRILLGITGYKNRHWKDKLQEIEDHRITEVALFLERFKRNQRKKIYDALLDSNIKEIPLVHIRNDMSKEELGFLVEKFNSKYLTIHESSFDFLDKWNDYHKVLFLEMNNNDFIPKEVDVEKVGGFCVDLSHFKAEEESKTKEYKYTFKRRKMPSYFGCNHLNGYSYEKNTDLHLLNSLKDFDYLKTLPRFLFGNKIGLECDNSISEQLNFKEYLVKMLNDLYLSE